mmetsp:Transcript_75866/g.222386  ORF Transcript_75866/g.222386 Transcript_75866/m.222386 type:complete len:219 (+) Transcript_75866:52-708(+)
MRSVQGRAHQATGSRRSSTACWPSSSRGPDAQRHPRRDDAIVSFPSPHQRLQRVLSSVAATSASWASFGSDGSCSLTASSQALAAARRPCRSQDSVPEGKSGAKGLLSVGKEAKGTGPSPCSSGGAELRPNDGNLVARCGEVDRPSTARCWACSLTSCSMQNWSMSQAGVANVGQRAPRQAAARASRRAPGIPSDRGPPGHEECGSRRGGDGGGGTLA